VSQDVDITEVSDPQELPIDAPVDSSVPKLKVLKGNPTDEELAALVCPGRRSHSERSLATATYRYRGHVPVTQTPHICLVQTLWRFHPTGRRKPSPSPGVNIGNAAVLPPSPWNQVHRRSIAEILAALGAGDISK
jgi:hypothetical protein